MVTIFLLGFSLVYMLIKNQVFKALEERLHSLYKDKIEADIQDIYREFESYSAIIDSRINRLKILTERQEASVRAWEAIQSDLKKSKTAKEVLGYLEEFQGKSALNPDEIEKLKKEIISDLKKYLADKLSLEKIKAPAVLSEKIPEKETPARKAAPERKSQPVARPQLNFSKTDEDFNAAELILEDLTEEKISVAPKSSRTSFPGEMSSITPKPQVEKEAGESKLLSTLASIGKTLSPIFLKPDNGPKEPVPPARKPGNFNELIKKEAVLQTEAPARIRQGETKEKAVLEEKVSMDSQLSPSELLSLIESLKISRTRPQALKSLLGHGFELNQIAELSSIPYSDLELTRNLYKI